MRNEYILLIKNGEVKFSNRIVPNHDKKRVQELVQEFCNLIGYEFTSDEQYAKDFYFKAYFFRNLRNKCFENGIDINTEKNIIFMLICECGILFEKDFDVYNKKRFENYVINENYNSDDLLKSSEIIYKAAELIIEEFKLEDDQRTNFENYIKYIRDKKGNLRKIKGINKQYCNEHPFPLDYNQYSKFLSYWRNLSFKNKKPEKYERTVREEHYKILNNSKINLVKLKYVWNNAINYEKSHGKKSKNKKAIENKLFIRYISIEKYNKFLREYIIPMVGSLDVNIFSKKLYNKANISTEIFISIYDIICKEKNISENAIAKRLMIWCCICDFFSDKDNKINGINVYESQDTYKICKRLKLSNSLPEMNFYSELDGYYLNSLALNIPTIALGYKIRDCIQNCLQVKIDDVAIINQAFGGTTILKDYKEKHQKEYKDLLCKVKSFYKTIESYERMCNDPSYSREDFSHFVKTHQFYRIKNFIDVSDKEIWKSVKFVYGVSEEKISARIEANSESLKIMIYESAIRECMKLAPERTMYNRLAHIFSNECK